MTAKERAAIWWGVEKYAHPNTLDALKEAFEAHAREAVEVALDSAAGFATAAERSERIYGDLAARDPVKVAFGDVVVPHLQDHAREAVEAEQNARERLEEACRDAMTAMQEFTASEHQAGSTWFHHFDDEIDACHAALDRVAE